MVILLIPLDRALSQRGYSLKVSFEADLCGRHSQVGSLAGAAYLLNDNAGVLRGTHREQKSRVEQKGKSSFDSDFQYEYEP